MLFCFQGDTCRFSCSQNTSQQTSMFLFSVCMCELVPVGPGGAMSGIVGGPHCAFFSLQWGSLAWMIDLYQCTDLHRSSTPFAKLYLLIWPVISLMTDNSETSGFLFGTDLGEDWSVIFVIFDEVSPQSGIQNSLVVSLKPQSKSAPLAAPQYRNDLSRSRNS